MQLETETKLATTIRKDMVRALNDFDMIADGDRLMVCVSGGKDSSVMLALLKEIQKKSERKFTLHPVILDQKQPGFDVSKFKTWIENLGFTLTVLERDTYSVVVEKVQGGTYCSLCSRFRRAILYDHAVEQKYTKLVLGHHREDALETLLLNLFYQGITASMPPKLKSDDGRNIVIRPMCYVSEKNLQELSIEWQIPIIPCNLCGSQDGLKRKKMKALLEDLEKDIPSIKASMINALSNIRPTQMFGKSPEL